MTRELDLLKSIQNGMAVTHHLEPAYFSAMCHAAQAVSDDPTVFLPQKIRQLEVADEAVDPYAPLVAIWLVLLLLRFATAVMLVDRSSDVDNTGDC